jgi:DNA-binding beta-propeller fold protein YncE
MSQFTDTTAGAGTRHFYVVSAFDIENNESAMSNQVDLVTVYPTLSTVISSGLSSPSGVAVDNAGNVYIADYGSNSIKKLTASSWVITTLVSYGLNGPIGVAVDNAGNVYIADFNSNAIKKWTASTGVVSTLVSTGLNGPIGVAVDNAGNVYIADSNNNAIKRWGI